MTTRGSRQGSVARLAAVVAAALIAPGAPAAWTGPEGPARSAKSLAVQSEPSGAAVSVDGQLEGTTPVVLEGILAGDHTVRLVKEGFLENSRVVSVPASGGSLLVTLTPAGPPTRAPAVQDAVPAGGDEKESKGGGRTKRILIGGLGLAGLTVGCLLTVCKGNDAPRVTSVTADPPVALQAATAVSLSAVASDPEGKALTYSWDFGDGTTGSGASVTHTYQTAGAFDVTVVVQDNESKKTTGTASIIVKSMAGRWTGRLDASGPITYHLAQSGSVIVGNYQAVYPGNRSVAGTVAGRVAAPDRVTMTVRVPNYFPLSFEAPLDAGMDSMSGTVTENGVASPFDLVRQ